MTAADALDLTHFTLWTVIGLSAPAVVPAMLTGVLIAFFQALTQVQEVTLTFVPKILAVFLSLVVFGGFIGHQLFAFSEMVYLRAQTGF